MFMCYQDLVYWRRDKWKMSGYMSGGKGEKGDIPGSFLVSTRWELAQDSGFKAKYRVISSSEEKAPKVSLVKLFLSHPKIVQVYRNLISITSRTSGRNAPLPNLKPKDVVLSRA